MCYEETVDLRGYHNKKLGLRGENAAARYLQARGMEILERNWVCPAGEADIIAEDGGEIVFIEVKTRSDIDKGFPSEAVDARKRSRYEKIAAWFLRDCNYVDVPVRFDVIALMVLSEDRAFLRHYVNAYAVAL
jgi:putative endonuclease